MSEGVKLGAGGAASEGRICRIFQAEEAGLQDGCWNLVVGLPCEWRLYEVDERFNV